MNVEQLIDAYFAGLGTRCDDVTPEGLRLASEAAKRPEERKGEDIDAWADRMAEDVKNAND